ncbi:MAG TPA: macro domain-containing protein [Rhizomicrobium sp.]|jgi:O-acetyl-ADP-ribose deacetylase (regulator of RNase III)
MSALRERLQAMEGDISMLAIEAIVNAANESLIMGGGVDGAIRGKAGDEMERDLRQIGRCPTGQAILTDGYALPARFVIHTVAPIWLGGGSAQKIALLAACCRNALALARMHAIAAVAFPCLGTGIYGWPADLAAETAFSTVATFLGEHDTPQRVVFCCFSPTDRERYETAIGRLG